MHHVYFDGNHPVSHYVAVHVEYIVSEVSRRLKTISELLERN